jgi:transposase
MSSSPSLTPMFIFKGWVVEDIDIDWSASQAVVLLRRDGRIQKEKCSTCGHNMTPLRNNERYVQDIPLGGLNVRLKFISKQMRCLQCNQIETITPPGISPNAQATDRLKRHVSHLCRYMPTNKVPEFVAISHDSARRWDKEVLMKTLPAPKLDDIRALLIDEKSIGKGHNYLTVVLNADTGETLFIGEGKRKETLNTFFKSLTIKQRASIQCVGIDRSGSYQSSVKAYLPAADIVYDKFHIVSNYNDVIDNIRRREWREAEEEDKTFIKGQRFNLFKNPDNLTDSNKSDLQALLSMNEDLNQAYILKDMLKQLWTYTYKACASKFLDKWIALAKETEISELITFARGLDRARDGLLSYCQHRITSAKIEAFNGVIKRIVSKACGYNDMEYLYLKIRQEALT